MNMLRVGLLALSVAFVSQSALGHSVSVTSHRCENGQFVRTGDDKFQVLEYCGAPTSQDVTSENTDYVEERLYYSGGKKRVIFTIRRGKILFIEELR